MKKIPNKIDFNWIRPGPKFKAFIQRCKNFTGKVFSKAFENLLVRGLVLAIIFLLGSMFNPFSEGEKKGPEEFFVQGKVHDIEGNPIAQAEVFIEQIEGYTFTKEDGSFKYKVEHTDNGEKLIIKSRKEGYEIGKNMRDFPKDNAPRQGNVKILNVTMILESKNNLTN